MEEPIKLEVYAVHNIDGAGSAIIVEFGADSASATFDAPDAAARYVDKVGDMVTLQLNACDHEVAAGKTNKGVIVYSRDNFGMPVIVCDNERDAKSIVTLINDYVTRLNG